MFLKAVLHIFMEAAICANSSERIYCIKRDSAGPFKLPIHNEHIYRR